MSYGEGMTPADVAAVTRGGMGGFGGGFGYGDGGAIWLIILFFFAMMVGGGNRGFGGGYGGGADGNLYPWLNNSQNINGGFRDQLLATNVNGLQNAVTAGFGDVQNRLCSGFAGVNANINNGFAQAEIGANARQMENMQQMFGIQSAQQQCCCDTRAGLADVKYTIATENCADRAALAESTRDIIQSQNAGTQRILDQMCQDKIDAKNDTIAQLRQELMFARGQASQDVQTAAIQAGQRALANEVEQYVLPTPRPAYLVQNPNCCTSGNNCGCGNF